MASTVCVDESFSVDPSGALSVRRAGDADPAAWPFPFSAALGNGLHFDPDLGLWVAPAPMVMRISHVRTNTPNRIFVGESEYLTDPLVATITNPSAIASMLLVLQLRWEFYFGQEAPTITWAKAGWDKSTTGVVPTQLVGWSAYPEGLIGDTFVGFPIRHTETVTDVLAPGGSSTFRVQPGMENRLGRMKYQWSETHIDGFGITI